MKKNVGILALFLALTVSIPGAHAQFCEGTLFTNLIPGDVAVVVTDGLLNVRSEPTVAGDLVSQLEPYTELPVIDGPVCADQHAWYAVRLDDDQTGWVAEASSDEYWLGKLPRKYTTYERPADPNGTYPTVRFTYPGPSIERIDFDSATMHGVTYSGEQIILRPLNGEPIFITVIPFEDFEDTPGGGPDRAEVLIDMISEWSDTALGWAYAYPNNQGEWPSIVVLKELQEFQNGRGFRYVAAYTDLDELQPVDENSFWYAFHGMTDDGAYFVNVTAPIQTPQLPAGPVRDPDDMTEYFAGYLPWITEIRAFLQTKEAASFSPMLGMINSLVYSLEIE